MAARSRRAAILAAVSVVAVLGIAVWGSVLIPQRAAGWVLMAFALPILWGYVELAQVRGDDPDTGQAIMTLHRSVIAWAGLTILLRVAPRLAIASDLLDASWAPMSLRLSGLSVGVGLMVFGNYLPKFASPWTVRAEPFEWQRVHRFCGWVFLLGGAAVTSAWLSLPLDQAAKAGSLLLPGIAVLAVGRKLVSLAAHGRSSPFEAR